VNFPSSCRRKKIGPSVYPQRLARWRPILETLEDRTLLSTSIPLNSNTWTSIGPAPLYASGGFVNGNVAGHQTSINPAWLYSGRITGIAADPTNANVIYIASASGGVWKTINGGTSWQALTDNQATLFMGAITVAPSNNQVIYAGTGEANLGPSKLLIARDNIYYGRGILKSMDGGQTWSLEAGNPGHNDFDRRTISRIVVDPSNANIVYVAVGALATNGLTGNTGIWKSIDGGYTWTNTTSAISTTDAYSDLAIDPANDQILYAAAGNPYGDTANGIYESTDAGAHWAELTNFPTGADPHVGRITIALSPSSPNVIYADVANVTHMTDANPNSSLYKMEKSSDGGTTWTQLTSTPNFMAAYGDYDTSLAVDPANPNTVYAGGQAGANTLIRSQDGGTTWQDIGVGVDGNGPHADHHALAFDASGKVLEGNDGGVWRLDDPNTATLHWTDLNANLATVQFNSVALDPKSPNIACAGAQDNGTDQFTDSLLWNVIDSGDGGYVLVSPSNGSLIYHDAPVASFGSAGFIEVSVDGGQDWSAATTGINAGSEPTDFYPPFVMDPSNPSRLFVGTSRVYQTTDGANTWTAISTPGTGGWTANTAIDAIAVSASNGNTIYAATKGHIFVTFNDGTSWQEVDVSGFNDHIAWLAVDPSNNQVAYAARDRFSTGAGGHVFKTTNGGATWTDISTTLPNTPTNTLVLDPRTGALYAGTDNGVFASTDSGQSWAVLAGEMPNVRVAQLQINPLDNILAAATHGRGLWEITLSSWTGIGPAPIANGQNPGNGPVSGRVTGVTTDPTNSNLIYVSTAGGGLWRSADGGQTWTPLTDNQATLTTGTILDANSGHVQASPAALYAGTGEANNSADSYYGLGLLKSLDGGVTWTLITGNSGKNEFNGSAIARIASVASNPNIVYVAVTGGAVNGVSGNSGVWKSSDGGMTWTNTTALVIATTAAFSDLAMDPNNQQVLLAAVGGPTGSTAAGVYRTTTGGASWAAAGNFPMGLANGVIRIAFAKTNPTGQHVVYASVTNPLNGGLLAIYKSTDDGTTWLPLASVPNYLGTTGSYASALIVDPTNSNIVYAGGGTGAGSLIESQDGGVTWTDISTGATGNNGPHGEHHGFAFEANDTLLDVNDGGVWRLDNAMPGSIHWTDITGNLAVTQFVGIAQNPSNIGIAFGGSQGNGTEAYAASPSWSEVRGGDGGFVRVDPNTPNTIYHTFGYLTGAGFLERSDDGGVTWNAKTSGINTSDPGNYDIPYVLDPLNSARLLLGTNRVYESTNRGDSWNAISTPNSGGWTTSAPIDTLAASGSTIYASAGGQIFVTLNDGASWTGIDIAGFSDHFNRLIIDPTNSQIAYIVRDRFSTASGGHVFKTVNGGATWADISTGLPNIPTEAIALDPRDGALYVGTDSGIYVSANAGTSWSLFGVGLPAVRVTDLQINTTLGVLTIGTYGRGAWEAPLTHFRVATASGTVTAGLAFSQTVTALDPFGNVMTGFAGTVHFSSTDSLAGLPADYTFSSTDAGVHTFAGVSLLTPGIETITASATANPLSQGRTSLAVTATYATHFVLNVSGGVTAGQPFTVTVEALDVNNNAVVGYNGTASFTATDHRQGVVLPSPYPFAPADQGSHTFTNGFTLITAGNQTLSVLDTAGASGSLVVPVSAAAATQITFGQQPTNATAGQAITPSISADLLDPFGNLSTSSAAVTLAIASGPGTLGGTTTVNANGGIATFSNVFIQLAGVYTISATSSGLTGATSNSFTISPAAPNHLLFGQQPTNTVAGQNISPAITVSIVDQFNNLTTSTATVSLGIASGPGTLGGTTTVGASGGVATFSGVFIQKAGTYTLSANSSGLAGATSNSFTISAAAASQLKLVPSTTKPTAGVAFTLTVTALDPFSNVATTYLGTVHFTSSDTQATLPANYTFASADAGVHTFTGVVLRTAGSRTVSATDTVNKTIKGKVTLTVLPAAASHFTLTASTQSPTMGQPFNLTVTALDAFNNVATGYRGTVHFTSSDGAAKLPGDYRFVALDKGTHTFQVTLNTVGSQTITVTDTKNSTITGSITLGVVADAVFNEAATVRSTSQMSTMLTPADGELTDKGVDNFFAAELLYALAESTNRVNYQ
jgi:hypothetical protein